MNLFLLRHGLAGRRDPDRFPDDSLRPLTAPGEKQLKQAAAAMRRLKLSFALILSSPLTRARQTAEIIADGLGLEPAVRLDRALAPDGDRRRLLRELSDLSPPPDDVLLVGHEPYLSELLALLASDRADLAVDLKKGGLARLAVAGDLAPKRCATLKWLLTPRQLRRIA